MLPHPIPKPFTESQPQTNAQVHVGKKNILDIFNLEIQAYWKRKEPGSPKKLPKAQTHKVDITTAPVKLFVLIPHYLKSNNMNLMQYQLIFV